MKGLLIKDILVIARQMKMFLLVVLFLSILDGNYMAPVAVLLGAVLPMTACGYDEQSKWEELAVMLPYSRKQLVLSKYLLGYLGMGAMAVFFLLIQLILTAFGRGDVAVCSSYLYYAVLSGLVFLAVNTPILLRFGSQKGRMVYIVFIAAAVIGGKAIRDAFSGVLSAGNLPLLLLAFAVAANGISIAIALRIKHA